MYISAANIKISGGCTKKAWPRSLCESCGRFFRLTTRAGTTVRKTEDSTHGITRSTISTAVKSLMTAIGAPPGATPVSLRRGGISAALADGVDVELRKIQSGHISSMWTCYADITRRDQLYDFPRCCGI